MPGMNLWDEGKGLPAHLLDELVDLGAATLHLGDLAHAAGSGQAEFACGKSSSRVTQGTEESPPSSRPESVLAFRSGFFLMLSSRKYKSVSVFTGLEKA